MEKADPLTSFPLRRTSSAGVFSTANKLALDSDKLLTEKSNLFLQLGTGPNRTPKPKENGIATQNDLSFLNMIYAQTLLIEELALREAS